MSMTSRLLILASCCGVAGCYGATITATKWDSVIDGSKAERRCQALDMRSSRKMDEVFSKYNGWNLLYISEYTTPNKTGTHGVVCFEKSTT